MSEILSYGAGKNAARRTDAELARVDHATELVVHKIRALSFAGEVAITRAVVLQLAQKAAEEIAPNGSESYAAIVQATTMGIVSLVSELGYRL